MQVVACSKRPANNSADVVNPTNCGLPSVRSSPCCSCKRSNNTTVCSSNKCSKLKCCNRLTATSYSSASKACSKADFQSCSVQNHWQARRCQERPAGHCSSRNKWVYGVKICSQSVESCQGSIKQPSACKVRKY